MIRAPYWITHTQGPIGSTLTLPTPRDTITTPFRRRTLRGQRWSSRLKVCGLSTRGYIPKLTFSLAGTQAILWGALPAGNKTFPSATYSIDSGSAGNSSPYTESSGQVIYYKSPQLSSAKHTLLVNVTSASNETPFFIDAFVFTPISGQFTDSEIGVLS